MSVNTRKWKQKRLKENKKNTERMKWQLELADVCDNSTSLNQAKIELKQAKENGMISKGK